MVTSVSFGFLNFFLKLIEFNIVPHTIYVPLFIMGVPQFFRWLSSKYNQAIFNAGRFEYISQYNDFSERTIQSKPNGIHHLYLDLNCLIHPTTHKTIQRFILGLSSKEISSIKHHWNDLSTHLSTDQKDFEYWNNIHVLPHSFRLRLEDEICQQVITDVQDIISLVQPKNDVGIFIDGIPPYAKMVQQRFRRFEGGQSRYRQILEFNNNIKQSVEFEDLFKKQDTSFFWDTVAISPGTTFMDKLSKYIHQAFKHKPYIISDTTENGEGEHKIFHILKEQYATTIQQQKRSTDKICIYGLDADLIMCGFTYYPMDIYLLREDVFHNNKNKETHCKKWGDDDQPDYTEEFIYLSIPILADNLIKEVHVSRNNEKIPFHIRKNTLDDFTLLMMILGNDFLPHLFGSSIRHNAIDHIIEWYRTHDTRFMFYHPMKTKFTRPPKEHAREYMTNDNRSIYIHKRILKSLFEFLKEGECARVIKHYTHCLQYTSRRHQREEITEKAYHEREQSATDMFDKWRTDPNAYYIRNMIQFPTSKSKMTSKVDNMVLQNLRTDYMKKCCCQYFRTLLWNAEYYFSREYNGWEAYFGNYFVSPSNEDIILFLTNSTQRDMDTYVNQLIIDFYYADVERKNKKLTTDGQLMMIVSPYSYSLDLPKRAIEKVKTYYKNFGHKYCPLEWNETEQFECNGWEKKPLLISPPFDDIWFLQKNICTPKTKYQTKID